MNKLKILLCTVISIIFLFIILEGTAYLIQSNRLIKEGYGFSYKGEKKPPYPTNIEVFSNHYAKINKEELFSNVAGKQYRTRPILVFGDAYAPNYLTEKLSKLTQNPVVNFANSGWSVQHMYHLLKNEELMETIKNPESILFVYNSDMKNRMTSFSFYPHHNFLYPKYKIQNDVLVEDTPKSLLVYKSYFYRTLERYIGYSKSYSKNPEIQQDNFELIKRLFEESRRVAELRFPTIKKFVILRYISPWDSIERLKNNENSAISQLEYNMWKQLEDEGFIVVDTAELNSKKNYNDENHVDAGFVPKNSTLDEILPWLVNKSKL